MRQTTRASLISHLSSQIVPHSPLWYISTLPIDDELLPTSLTVLTLNKKNTRGIVGKNIVHVMAKNTFLKLIVLIIMVFDKARRSHRL
jgi:hypothetical protein